MCVCFSADGISLGKIKFFLPNVSQNRRPRRYFCLVYLCYKDRDMTVRNDDHGGKRQLLM